MEYKLRWGDRTALYTILMAFLSGTFIVWAAYKLAEDAAHGTATIKAESQFFWPYYSPLLGYFVVASICQSHYFKTSGMKLEHSIRYFVSIGAACVLFGTNEIMFYKLGIANHEHMTAHFLWILLGFYLFGFDDFLYAGKLSKLPAKLVGGSGRLSRFLGHNSFKASIWYVVIWIIWGIIVARGTMEDHKTFNNFAGPYQWAVILLLLCAVQLKDIVPLAPHKNVYVRGTFWLSFTLVGGIVIGYFLFWLNGLAFDGITDGDNWHHVLYQGTYPLTPIIIFGLYTNHLGNVDNIWKRAALRSAVVAAGVVALYFFFHAVLIPTGIYDVPGVWYHRIDLYWNFTVSIIPLTWAWFTARWGFMEPVGPDENGGTG